MSTIGLFAVVVIGLYAAWLLDEIRQAPLLPPDPPELGRTRYAVPDEDRGSLLVFVSAHDVEVPAGADGWAAGDVLAALTEIEALPEVRR